jgi:membrane-associated progesterone receptor component
MMATELTAAQLRAYDGTDPSKPIYVSVRGKVYDVTSGRGFYGPGGAYAVFAGREASRALGKMSKDEADVSGDLSGLTDKELGVLADWETKFQAKYPVVARLADASTRQTQLNHPRSAASPPSAALCCGQVSV